MKNNDDYSEKVATKIIEQLEAGTAVWQKPWKTGELSLPMNPTTEKRYKGMNALWLSMQGHSDPRWLTYKQATEIGAQVRKGAKGTQIEFWKFTDVQLQKDENGKPILDENGEQKKITVNLERPRRFTAVVFNAEQIDGLPALEPKIQTEIDEINERAEALLVNSGAVINYVAGDRAFYNAERDQITLPEPSQFVNTESYYSTALHELGHWTGHESRLNRDLANTFGSEAYAKEELRAEIASLMLSEKVGVAFDPAQHTAYVGSWIKALKEDHREIFRAASDAEKITSYVMQFDKNLTVEKIASKAINDNTISNYNLEKDNVKKVEKSAFERAIEMQNEKNAVKDKSRQLER